MKISSEVTTCPGRPEQSVAIFYFGEGVGSTRCLVPPIRCLSPGNLHTPLDPAFFRPTSDSRSALLYPSFRISHRHSSRTRSSSSQSQSIPPLYSPPKSSKWSRLVGFPLLGALGELSLTLSSCSRSCRWYRSGRFSSLESVGQQLTSTAALFVVEELPAH